MEFKGVGLRQSHISMWERGEREPSISNLIDMSKYFNCSIDFLVGQESADKAISFLDYIKSNVGRTLVYMQASFRIGIYFLIL